MSRIDRNRIDAAREPVVELIATRFADLDMQGHINNGAAVTLLQEARTRFNGAIGLPRMTHSLRAMVASLRVEFARELYHPAPVEIATTILSVGRTSFVMGQALRQNGQSAVYAETVIVMADADGPTPLPEDVRRAYSEQANEAA
ncbi:thioesterase family protein [Sphingomonas sp. BIUV-7]|uniref:Thioesterase family protein n=1 Tax=Sphingomonas natans TaxID=3063330 RepID=A0ABT8Y853_9SPHN|nr:thioesterase family protein [Sphingomonas sp. BIUV-7]MDO6414503.1 thioesterase family protein [Sphingomonas sp. BIUV-7]